MAIENIGLVLEGGGMRGLYTCGVLDFFLDAGLNFPYVIGVSAGACNAVSYISKQRGRNLSVNVDYVRDPRYMSIRNLIKEKSYFGMNFIFKDIPQKYVSFDFEAFLSNDCDFKVVTTDCDTGKPVYFGKDDCKGDFDLLRASSSLPMLSPMVNFKGYHLLDGGVSDPIPIRRAIMDGYHKNIIILTRDSSYRKSPIQFESVFKMFYRNHPALVNAMQERHIVYNESLETIEKLKNRGDVFVIQSAEPLKVDRLEKDPKRLRALYDLGYQDAKRQLEALMAFIRK